MLTVLISDIFSNLILCSRSLLLLSIGTRDNYTI